MFNSLFAMMSPNAVFDSGFSLGVYWQALIEAVAQKRAFAALTNEFIIILSVALLILAIVAKSKKLLMLLIAVWGYVTVFHFTIEDKGAGEVATATGKAVEHGLSVGGLGPLVMFFVGFIVITGILLYLGFIKGD